MSPSPSASCQSLFVQPPACRAVLLIEDDDVVAGLVIRILARRAQRVLRAANGAEGEKLFAEHREEIGLVMVDCWLPDVAGTTLCQRFRREAPDVPILLTSGCDNAEARRLAASSHTAFLPKPFYPAQVDHEVSVLLGEGPRRAA